MQVQGQIQTSGVLRIAQNDGTSGRTAKLADGARQFEAMMLEQILKPLKFGESPDAAGNDDSSDGANDTLQGYGTEALAKAIATQGGFGIARQIIRQVTAQDSQRKG